MMEMRVLYNGTEITTDVISVATEKRICSGLGTANVVVKINSSQEFLPYGVITLYKSGTKLGEYFIVEITDSVPDATKRLSCQDGSKRIQDYFISDTYPVTEPTSCKYWLEKFLTMSGTVYNFNTDEEGNLVSNNTQFGLQDVHSTSVMLLQMAGWYMYFDENNVAQIGHFFYDADTFEHSLDGTEILSLNVHKDDLLFRNRALVYGQGSLSSNTWVHAEATRFGNDPEYDSNDVRSVVVANQYIPDHRVAYEIATKAVREFSKDTEVVSILVTGLKSYKIGETLFISTEYGKYSGIITGIGFNTAQSGETTLITINERCPRLFTYYNYGGSIYVGTDGNGVWRKYLNTNHTWSDFSTGIASEDMVVTDLKISEGIFACVAGKKLYYRDINATAWIKYDPGTLRDNSNVSYDDYVCVGCAINRKNGHIFGTFTDMYHFKSWVIELSATGTLVKKKYVLRESTYDSYRTFDIDIVDNTPIITGVDSTYVANSGVYVGRSAGTDPFGTNQWSTTGSDRYDKRKSGIQVPYNLDDNTITYIDFEDPYTYTTAPRSAMVVYKHYEYYVHFPSDPTSDPSYLKRVDIESGTVDSVEIPDHEYIDPLYTDKSSLMVTDEDTAYIFYFSTHLLEQYSLKVDFSLGSYSDITFGDYEDFQYRTQVIKAYCDSNNVVHCIVYKNKKDWIYPYTVEDEGIFYYTIIGGIVSSPSLIATYDQTRFFAFFRIAETDTRIYIPSITFLDEIGDPGHLIILSINKSSNTVSYGDMYDYAAYDPGLYYQDVYLMIPNSSEECCYMLHYNNPYLNETWYIYRITANAAELIKETTNKLQIFGNKNNTYYSESGAVYTMDGNYVCDFDGDYIGANIDTVDDKFVYTKLNFSTTDVFKKSLDSTDPELLFTAYTVFPNNINLGEPLIAGQVLLYDKTVYARVPMIQASGWVSYYPTSIENGPYFSTVDYATGPTILEIDQDYPIITKPFRQSYALSGFVMYDLIPSGMVTTDFKVGYPNYSTGSGYVFSGFTATLPWAYYHDVRSAYDVTTSGNLKRIYTTQHTPVASGNSNIYVVDPIDGGSVASIYETMSGQVQCIETTNTYDKPYIFVSTSGDRYRFFQKDGVLTGSGYLLNFVDRTNNLPDYKINVIRVDDIV